MLDILEVINLVDERIRKGIRIADGNCVAEITDNIRRFEVIDPDGSQRVHIVTYSPALRKWSCDCEDFEFNQGQPCKHIHGVRFKEGL